jgi:hypothetical protein
MDYILPLLPTIAIIIFWIVAWNYDPLGDWVDWKLSAWFTKLERAGNVFRERPGMEEYWQGRADFFKERVMRRRKGK